MMRARRAAYRIAEGKGAEARTRWPFHRVRAAAWLPLTINMATGEAVFGALTVLSAREHEESAIVERLFDQLNALPSAVAVSWGGECKDYPVLRRDACEFGLRLPPVLRDLHPHSRGRIDLCSEVAAGGDNVHLPEYAAATSIPAKPSPSKNIGDLVLAGNWQAVEEQVRADVLTTTIILLRHLSSRGEIDTDLPLTMEALAKAAAESAPQSAFITQTLRPWVRDLVRRSGLRGRVFRAAVRESLPVQSLGEGQ